jgi:glycosyltransferase involved in cell wall biosynthesis
MQQLAKNNRVLWLNSVSTRKPNLSSGRDLKKIFRKIGGSMKGPQHIENDLWVYTPLILPLPYSKTATAINRFLLKLTVKRLRRKFNIKDFQLWTFLPSVVDYVGHLEESVVVYYCVDQWSGFTYIDEKRLSASEAKLCEQADIIFATANSLVESKLPINPETHLALHGVDYELFSQALSDDLPLPPDLASLPQPILGFYGTIQDWVDLDLIAYLAERHPEWSIAMVGNTLVDVSRLEKYPNVHFLGRKPHSELPKYCKGFSVGLLPQKVNELTLHMNPIKLREYLCAGLPVVSTALPEVRHYSDYCAIAENYEEFERAVEAALQSNSLPERKRRNEAMKSETWEMKVEAVSQQVMRVKQTL